MRQSILFTKTIKETPRDEVSFNAQALIKGGFIDKLGAGIYSFLPLGLRVHNKICQIIREEMNAIGGQEILMPALIPKENWQKTKRWTTFDALFKLKGVNKKEYALGATHEEVIAPLVQKHVFSYKELPVYAYQIQTKFRNEPRAKGGLLRGREFSMKDLYSFHTDTDDLDEYYEKVKEAYFKILKRLALEEITYFTYASGGAFSRYSHEFQTLAKNGEDTIYLCEHCQVAVSEEIIEEQKTCPQCQNKNLKKEKSIEVANIFKLGTRFSKAFGFSYIDKNGQEKDVQMGCYGFGSSRAMGTIVEVHHDEKGIIWPAEVAPYQIHLVELGQSEKVRKFAEKVYQILLRNQTEVLYDDRLMKSSGEKFADADLIGIPIRLVVSEKTVQQNMVELKRRDREEIELIKVGEIESKILPFLKGVSK